MKKHFISTAIPYVNAKPHIGFAMEVIQADVIARYWREKGADVFLLTGSDENSLKNVRAAEKAGQGTVEFVQQHAEEFKKLGGMLNLSFDDFIRTREDRHMKGAQKLWNACRSEDIYKKSYKGLYCVGCEQFYTEKECPDQKCPEHKTDLEVIEEENYFFKLSNYQDQLKELIESDKIRIVPESRKNEMLKFIEGGLEDFSISRSQERAKHWGVPVPGDEDQVMYVWFDALGNYITALDYENDGEKFEAFWQSSDCTKTHVIGKGILRFHAIYWPAMLLSAGIALPDEIFVHGYITIEDEKISKSVGNVIHPKELVDEFGIDATRYYFLREIPATGDGDYSNVRMKERYAELANQLGNLVSRVAAMVHKYFDGDIDTVNTDWSSKQENLDAAMQGYDFKKYLDAVWEVVGQANEMIDKKAPFKLVKEDEVAAKQILSEVAEMIRFIGQSILPFLPETGSEILKRYSGDKILVGDPLFPRRD